MESAKNRSQPAGVPFIQLLQVSPVFLSPPSQPAASIRTPCTLGVFACPLFHSNPKGFVVRDRGGATRPEPKTQKRARHDQQARQEGDFPSSAPPQESLQSLHKQSH